MKSKPEILVYPSQKKRRVTCVACDAEFVLGRDKFWEENRRTYFQCPLCKKKVYYLVKLSELKFYTEEKDPLEKCNDFIGEAVCSEEDCDQAAVLACQLGFFCKDHSTKVFLL